MSSGLRDLLKLPEAKQALATAQAQEFGQAFREGMAGVNRELQVVTAQASPAEHKTLQGQRMRLFEAFQKVSAQIDPVNPATADKAIGRVMAAVVVVEGKASALAQGAKAGRNQWLQREAEFDDQIVQIGELEQARHPKAAALRKLGETIRSRANSGKYQQSVTALEQMRPKLDQIYAQHFQQLNGVDGETGDSAPRERLTAPVRDQETGAETEATSVQVANDPANSEDTSTQPRRVSPEKERARQEIGRIEQELQRLAAELNINF